MSEATARLRPEDDSEQSTECIFPAFEPMHTYTAPSLDCMVKDGGSQTWNPIPFREFRSRNSYSGLLDLLPTELLHMILAHLDFDTLGDLRLSCYGTRLMVDSAPAFHISKKHAWSALASLGRLGALGFHTSGDLYKTLFEKECVCGDYGPYLFVLTGERCCIFCLMTNPRFAVIRRANAFHYFGSASLSGLNYVNEYKEGKRGPERHEWYSVMQVRELSQRAYGINGRKLTFDPDGKWGRITRFLAVTREFPQSKRKLAIPMPYLPSLEATHAEHGLYCRYCTLPSQFFSDTRASLLTPLRATRPPMHTIYLTPMLVLLMSHIDRRKALSRAEWYEHLSRGCTKSRGKLDASNAERLLEVNKIAFETVLHLTEPDADLVYVRIAVRNINNLLREYCVYEGITDEKNVLMGRIPMPGSSFTI